MRSFPNKNRNIDTMRIDVTVLFLFPKTLDLQALFGFLLFS